MAETSNCTSSLNTEIKTDANSNGCDAWLLFSLHSAPASPSSNQPSNWDRNNSVSNLNKSNPMGKLLCQEARGFEYLIRDNRTIIGRNSSKGDVDVNMGHSTFISRQHLEIFFEPPDNFFLHCMGKNGVFIDGTFQRRCQEPVKLPTSCVFRFPSTNIRLEFQSLVERNCPETKVLDGETERTNHNNSNNNNNNNNNATLNNTNGQLDSRYYSSLKVNIPEINNTGKEPKLISPVPSPTGTLSAANSCPTSPGNIGVRFRYANNRQDDFQKMVNYAMSKSEEKLQTNGQNISHQLNNNKGEMKTVPGTMKEFQLTPQPGQPVQFAQHGTPIIANITNTNLILNNGAQLINAQNGQIIATSTPPAIAIKNNHLNQRTKNVQSPTNYTIEPSDDDGKPPYSYAQLIVQAIASAPDKQLTLSGIYSFIAKNYPYYRTADKGWQNSIRHNLSLNRYFLKVPRSQSEPGKGSFWRIDPASEGKLVEQSCKKRRQRPNSGFNSDMPRNSSRSEPTSPSHVTPGLVTPDSLSREPSPVPSQQETIESEIISSGFILQNTDTNNGYPTNKFYSSKSMPGSPGDLTKLQPSQINSVITTTIPISTTNQLANNLIAQSQLTLTNGKLFLDRSLQPSVASSLSSSSSNNVVHQTPTNAAATAAAIALTNLQNKCELSQPSSSSSSNIIQPTVIVQAPSNSIPVVTSASTNEPDNLKPMVICPPTTTVVTVNQTEIEPSTSNNDNDNNNNNNNNNNNSNNNNNNNNNASINSAVTTGPEISSSISNISAASTANSSNTSTAISRPIDLLTSVALAAAADETSSSSNSNITTSTTTTTANVSSIQSDIETNSQTNNDINESTMEKNNKIDLDEEPVSNNKREFDLIESDTGIDGPENKRIKLADDSTVL